MKILEKLSRETKQKIILYSGVFTLLGISIGGYALVHRSSSDQPNMSDDHSYSTESDTLALIPEFETMVDKVLNGEEETITVPVDSSIPDMKGSEIETTQGIEFDPNNDGLLAPNERKFTYQNFVMACDAYMEKYHISADQREDVQAMAMACNINHVPAVVFDEYLEKAEGIDLGRKAEECINRTSNLLVNRENPKYTDISELIFNEQDRNAMHAVAESTKNILDTTQPSYSENVTKAVACLYNSYYYTESDKKDDYHWPMSFKTGSYNIYYMAYNVYGECIVTHYFDNINTIPASKYMEKLDNRDDITSLHESINYLVSQCGLELNYNPLEYVLRKLCGTQMDCITSENEKVKVLN